MSLRRAGITQTEVLAAIERVPREMFLPPSFHDQAYEDQALPIGQGQTISQPQIVATMTEGLSVGKSQKVLEIGTGSGYQTAVLAHLSRRVYTIERFRSLSRAAEERLQALRMHNVTYRVGDGHKGWPEQAPFERIIVTAAAAEMPQALVDQLAPDGVMVIPIGAESGEQILVRVAKIAGEIACMHLGDVRFVPLVPGTLPEEDRQAIAGASSP
jgi:protein-L-isoaspartate(D-aspartate) O-methyltransferase